MHPMLIAAIAGGGVKALGGDKERKQIMADRELAAKLAVLSPYSNQWDALAKKYAEKGLTPYDELGGILSAAAGGASFGGGLMQMDAKTNAYDAMANESNANAEFISPTNAEGVEYFKADSPSYTEDNFVKPEFGSSSPFKRTGNVGNSGMGNDWYLQKLRLSQNLGK